MDKRDNGRIRNIEFSEFADSPLPLYYIDSDVAFVSELEELPQYYAVKLKFNVFVGCISGRMELDVNNVHCVLEPTQVFICPSNQIIDNVMVTPDFKFEMMCLTDRIIQSLLSTNVDIWNRAVYVRKEHVVTPRHDSQRATGFMSMLKGIIDHKENPFREEMVRSLLQIILLAYCGFQKKIEEKEGGELLKFRSPQGKVLFTRFCELLRDEEVKHRPVYYYAEKLCISAKYLSYICKEVTGKSVNSFIQQAVVDDINHYLRNTNLSVKEISIRIGFSNISFFGKYVKAHFGVSPNEFRKQLSQDK